MIDLKIFDSSFDEEKFVRENLSFLLDSDDFASSNRTRSSDRFSTSIAPSNSIPKETLSLTGFQRIPNVKKTSNANYKKYPTSNTDELEWQVPITIEDISFGQEALIKEQDEITRRNNFYADLTFYKIWCKTYINKPPDAYFKKMSEERNKGLHNGTSINGYSYTNTTYNTHLAIVNQKNSASASIAKVQLNSFYNSTSSLTGYFDRYANANSNASFFTTSYTPAAFFRTIEIRNKYFAEQKYVEMCKFYNDSGLDSTTSDLSASSSRTSTPHSDFSIPPSRTSTPINSAQEKIMLTPFGNSEEACALKPEYKTNASSLISVPMRKPKLQPELKLSEFLSMKKEKQKTTSKMTKSVQTSHSNKQVQFCKFCYKNGELSSVYMSHITKLEDGTIKCPILRKYACDLCGATGDKAHTRKYCPLNVQENIFYPVFRRLTNGVLTTNHNHK